MLEYTIDEKGAFCKDGHTMFTLDILSDLKRMAYLETLYANEKEGLKPCLLYVDPEKSCQALKDRDAELKRTK